MDVMTGLAISFVVGAMFVLFKIWNVIDWSWGWVTLPFWGPLALLGALIVWAFITDAFEF